jgi:hypothetical protein
MSELSHAAQTVINAAIEAGGGYGYASPVLHARLAAALRAVIETCAHTDFGDHWVIPASDLKRIADELEAE